MWQVTYKNRKNETECYYFYYKFMANLTVCISKFLKRTDIRLSEYNSQSVDNKYTMSSIICKQLPIEGRIYDSDSLEKTFKDYVERFNVFPMFGELDRSDSNIIQLQRISHKITESKISDNGDLYIEFELLDTPNGQLAKKMVDAGVDLVIAPKIIGPMVEDTDNDGKGLGTYHVEAEKIISFDLIQGPKNSIYEDKKKE